jgi:hypothetical protein
LGNSGVYIDLDAALDVRPLAGVKELIQQRAYERLKELLTERLEELRKPQKLDERKDDDGTALFIDRRQNAIAIHYKKSTQTPNEIDAGRRSRAYQLLPCSDEASASDGSIGSSAAAPANAGSRVSSGLSPIISTFTCRCEKQMPFAANASRMR